MTYSQIITALILLSIMILGLISILNKRNTLIGQHKFTSEYLLKFSEFTTSISKSTDVQNKSYIWLTKNVDKMQEMIGPAGKVYYKPAFERIVIQDYQILVNTITQLANSNVHMDDLYTCNNLLLRFTGFLENQLEELHREVYNPFVWFFYGVKIILTSPLYFLNWFGILDVSATKNLSESLLTRFASGIVALIGFASSIIAIIKDWGFIVGLFQSILKISD